MSRGGVCHPKPETEVPQSTRVLRVLPAARSMHKLQGAGIMPEHTLSRKQKCPRGSKRNSLLTASGKVTAQQGSWHRRNKCGASRASCPSCKASVLASSPSPKVPRAGRGRHYQGLCNLQPCEEVHAGAPSPHSTPMPPHPSLCTRQERPPTRSAPTSTVHLFIFCLSSLCRI